MKIVLKVFIYFCISIGIMYGAFIVSKQFKTDSLEYRILSPLAAPIQKSVEAVSSIVKPELKDVVNRSLVDTNGTYGVAIKNLTSGEEYFFNEHKVFQPASLYKLWVMATVFDRVQKGFLKENAVISKKSSVLYKEFGFSTLQNIDDQNQEESTKDVPQEPIQDIITLTVADALEQMITVSDNTSALLLSSKVGLSKVSAFLKQEGLTESALGTPPKTTAWDIFRFYEKLYYGEIVDREFSDKMLEMLSRQKLNDRIPKLLPNGVRVAHKTGEIDSFKHDAGIVFSHQGDYIIIVLTKTNNSQKAAQKIAEISEAIYYYFNK